MRAPRPRIQVPPLSRFLLPVVEEASTRILAAQTVLDLRGLHSRAYLRGFIVGVQRSLDSGDPQCPYARATAQADAFWAGMAQRIELVKRLMTPEQHAPENVDASRDPPTLRPQTRHALAERASEHWEEEELAVAIDAYMTGAGIVEIAASLQRLRTQ
jgi:hypothetical protein